MKTTKTVTFTFDAETIETLARLAQAAGKSRSEYLRDLVHAADMRRANDALQAAAEAPFPPQTPEPETTADWIAFDANSVPTLCGCQDQFCLRCYLDSTPPDPAK